MKAFSMKGIDDIKRNSMLNRNLIHSALDYILDLLVLQEESGIDRNEEIRGCIQVMKEVLVKWDSYDYPPVSLNDDGLSEEIPKEFLPETETGYYYEKPLIRVTSTSNKTSPVDDDMFYNGGWVDESITNEECDEQH